jgi:hypothetical protein
MQLPFHDLTGHFPECKATGSEFINSIYLAPSLRMNWAVFLLPLYTFYGANRYSFKFIFNKNTKKCLRELFLRKENGNIPEEQNELCFF